MKNHIHLFFFAAVQLFFIGVIGEYIGAIHTQVLKSLWLWKKKGLISIEHRDDVVDGV